MGNPRLVCPFLLRLAWHRLSSLWPLWSSRPEGPNGGCLGPHPAQPLLQRDAAQGKGRLGQARGRICSALS